MDSAWDSLLELLEHLAADPSIPITAETERTFAALAQRAMADKTIDTELHVPDIARWLCGLAYAHREIRRNHPGGDTDRDLGPMLLIATRWLHPARPR